MSSSLILAVNAGSSSLKISVYKPKPNFNTQENSNEEPVTLLLTASFANLSSPPALFSFSFADPSIDSDHAASQSKQKLDSIDSHNSAFRHFLSHLTKMTPLSPSHIARVCHRVVHGGSYAGPVVISSESYNQISLLSDLAPLHNRNALAVIRICLESLPDSTSIACFDSSFHQTLLPHIYGYAIGPGRSEDEGVEKTHISCVALGAHLSLPLAKTTIIALHLGSGASICAIRNGQSLDTTMGLTPLSGLPGATRSGDVDPSLIFHYTSEADRERVSHASTRDVHVTEAEHILNTQAGWSALTGTTDFGAITALAFPSSTSQEPSPKHLHAFTLLVDRILNFLGAYILKLGGPAVIDAIVFSGGVGERSAPLRKEVIQACEGVLGHKWRIDDGVNKRVGKEDDGKETVVDVGLRGDGMGRVLVCRTDEQVQMARECVLTPPVGSTA